MSDEHGVLIPPEYDYIYVRTARFTPLRAGYPRTFRHMKDGDHDFLPLFATECGPICCFFCVPSAASGYMFTYRRSTHAMHS